MCSRPQAVSRCPIHASAADPSNAGVEAAILGHLVRCMDPASSYRQDPASGRLSVVTAVREAAPGCDYFTLVYQVGVLSCPLLSVHNYSTYPMLLHKCSKNVVFFK